MKILLSCLRLLGSVIRTAAAALVDARRIKLAAHDGVAQTNVFYATAQKHDRVLLQIVPLPRNVRGNFHAVGEAHAGNLADGGVRFARRLGRYARTDSPLEWRRIE